MYDIDTDSGDEITTSTAIEAPRPHDQATGREAEKERQSAEARRAAEERKAAENAEIGQAREVGSSDTFVAGGGDGGGRKRRLLLIGLDGATPELAIGAWRTQLPTLDLLTNRGTRGRLHSSLPWTSAPAWQSLLSGQDPGHLGVYGAERRLNASYAAPTAIDSRAIQAARLWDALGRAGYHVGVVGAPATTPPPRVQGDLIGDRLVNGAIAAYPESFGHQAALWLADQPPQPLAGDEIDRIVGAAYARAEQRFWLARRMLARSSYDCFVLCDDGIATVQRALWHTIDVTHQRYRAQHPFADAISAFYRFIDEQIGELLHYVDDDTVIAIGSANGAQALDGELALNDWLVDQGELRLFSTPAQPSPLAECAVDWPNTRAWAGDSGAIYLNLAGREPRGSVGPEQAEQLIDDLAARLRSTTIPHAAPLAGGRPAIEAYRPSALYSATQGVAPDLIVIFNQPGWRASSLAGHRDVWLNAATATLDAAGESPDGFFVIYDPRNPGHGREIDDATIYDLAPTLLALFGEPPPARSRGRVLC